MRKIIYKFSNVCQFDYTTAYAVSGKVFVLSGCFGYFVCVVVGGGGAFVIGLSRRSDSSFLTSCKIIKLE